MAGATWLTLTTRVAGPVSPSARKTASTAPTPSAVQYGRRPSTPSRAPTARLRAQTWLSRLRADSRGSVAWVSTTLSGPRLLAAVAVGSYPSPAAEGRDWK
ncbi:hypothetical protein Prubr_54450 [Polymorphospora rubra]|uniref:Uncharacterized protein n=1 Tax=Polymorphospora rubra TaxID=338584 RepID=A0A810N7H9_9ACTN|nr:hypothetical protein Prubr_54450 [Polymorphospora rubra]